MLVVGGKAVSYTLGVQMAEAHLRNGLALGVLDLLLALLLALPACTCSTGTQLQLLKDAARDTSTHFTCFTRDTAPPRACARRQ
jgi:hypothetical protein